VRSHIINITQCRAFFNSWYLLLIQYEKLLWSMMYCCSRHIRRSGGQWLGFEAGASRYNIPKYNGWAGNSSSFVRVFCVYFIDSTLNNIYTNGWTFILIHSSLYLRCSFNCHTYIASGEVQRETHNARAREKRTGWVRTKEVQQGESGFIIKTMHKRVTFNVLE